MSFFLDQTIILNKINRYINTPIFSEKYPTLVEQYFFLIFFNALIYSGLLVFFFSIFFLFDFRIFRTLSEYKFFKTTAFINTSMTLLFLSLAGIPPLLGFTSKFFIFIFLLNSQYFLLFIFMVFFNLFVMYFYIQNVRFLFGKTYPNIYIYKKSKVFINQSLIAVLSFSFFINITGIFFFEYFLIFLHQFVFSMKVY